MAQGETIAPILSDTICDVPGIKVGHVQNEAAMTGCSVIVPDQPVIASVEIRGFAPGTRELALLDPRRQISHIHALVLTGGSAFGLDSASGVVEYLEEQGIGYETGVARVPIVPAAVIYDLAVGSSKIRPDREMGYRAAQAATAAPCRQGLVGAGTGATVGKFAGQRWAMAGGIGTCSLVIDQQVIIAALVVVNALGNIIDPKTGQTIAGAYDPITKQFFDPLQFLEQPKSVSFAHMTNTTLAVVATSARLTKTEAQQLACIATNGITRCTRPAHTPYDGDVVFALSTEQHPRVDLIRLGAIAEELVAAAIVKAVRLTNHLSRTQE